MARIESIKTNSEVEQGDVIGLNGASLYPPVSQDSNSVINDILLSGTAELTLSPLLGDPAVVTCGAPLNSGLEMSGVSRPWGWLLPVQDTQPETPPVSLQESLITVGRDISLCSLVLEDFMFQSVSKIFHSGHVSKVHFEICRRGGIFLIKNRSLNGTYVNGTELTKDRVYELRHKDQIGVLDPSFHLFDFVDENSYLRTSTFPVEVITKYLVGCVVGAGTFSTVRRAWTRETGKPIALKIIKKHPFSLLNGPYSESYRCNELEVMMKLRHPCIGQLIDHAESYRELVIGIEYCTGGELGRMVERDRAEGTLKEDTAKFQFYQVAQAVSYLHSLGICHRDVKPANILLKEPHNRSLLKLVDFGLSKLLSEKRQMSSVVGTPWYIAPEVTAVTRRPWDSYTVKSDCWSLGVLLYVILSGEKPYLRKSDGKYSFSQIGLEEEISSGRLLYNVSQEARFLVTALLQVDPVQRSSARGILSHKWLTQHMDVCLAAEKLMWGEGETGGRKLDIQRQVEMEGELQERVDGEGSNIGGNIGEQKESSVNCEHWQGAEEEFKDGCLLHDVKPRNTEQPENIELNIKDGNIDVCLEELQTEDVKKMDITQVETNSRHESMNVMKNRPRPRSQSRKRKNVTNLDVAQDSLGRRKRRNSEVVLANLVV